MKTKQPQSLQALPIRLRPHHALCMQFFIGKGYSEEFTKYMYQTLALPPSTPVRITTELDHLCKHCPNHPTGICNAQERVAGFDKKVSDYCHFLPEEEMTMEEFFTRAKEEILAKDFLKTICGDCQFYDICSAKQ